ncbi:MAG: RNA 2',3'-cyclic phosphodiesterase [Thermoanaerobaculia bacterium]
MTDAGGVRAFLAVPPDPGWVESARALLGRARPELPEASWTRPESWHLTLRFLGELSRERLSRFAASIDEAVRNLSACDLSTRGAVVFPPRGPARVVGAGFAEDSGSAALSDLAGEAEACARRIGLEPQRRPFHPHVTFARLRRPWPAGAVARFREETDGWGFPVWPVRSCVLYESVLAREGAIHTAAGQWALPAPEGISA